MKSHPLSLRRVVGLAFSGAVLWAGPAGCASGVISDSDLKERTAFALGMDEDDISIHSRVDSGFRSDYRVRTNRGSHYRCYCMGTIGMLGPMVSDAVCVKTKGSQGPARSSNALLDAAGR